MGELVEVARALNWTLTASLIPMLTIVGWGVYTLLAATLGLLNPIAPNQDGEDWEGPPQATRTRRNTALTAAGLLAAMALALFGVVSTILSEHTTVQTIGAAIHAVLISATLAIVILWIETKRGHITWHFPGADTIPPDPLWRKLLATLMAIGVLLCLFAAPILAVWAECL